MMLVVGPHSRQGDEKQNDHGRQNRQRDFRNWIVGRRSSSGEIRNNQDDGQQDSAKDQLIAFGKKNGSCQDQKTEQECAVIKKQSKRRTTNGTEKEFRPATQSLELWGQILQTDQVGGIVILLAQKLDQVAQIIRVHQRDEKNSGH